MARGLRALPALTENLGSWNSHHSSQSSLTPVTTVPSPTSDFFGHQECVWCTYTQRGKTHIHIKQSKNTYIELFNQLNLLIYFTP